MLTYTIRRLIQAIPIMLGISLLIFMIVQLAPGDPIDRFRTPRVRPEQLEALMRLYGLDRPLWEQYFKWLTAFFQFCGTRRPGATRSTRASRSAT